MPYQKFKYNDSTLAMINPHETEPMWAYISI